GPQLVALDAATGAVRWSVTATDGTVFTHPVFDAGNVVTVTTGATVELRAGSDGALLKSARTNDAHPECWPTQIEGPLVIMCGSLSRISAESEDIFVPGFTPQ